MHYDNFISPNNIENVAIQIQFSYCIAASIWSKTLHHNQFITSRAADIRAAVSIV